MVKCKHPINMRQAVAGGVDSFSYAPYGVVCLKCGEVIFSGIISKDESYPKPGLLYDAISEEGEQ